MHLQLSRTTVGMILFFLLVLLALLVSSVPIAGAAVPETKKGEAPRAGTVLDEKARLQDNDPKDPARDQPCKTYAVKLHKGKTYVIDMVSTDFDTYLRLETAKGETLAEDDDSGGDLNAQIVFSPEADAEYKLVATRFADGSGTYTLKVRELSYKTGRPQTLKDGEWKVEAKLTAADPEDPVGPRNHFKLYSIKMRAGNTYYIDLASGDFDAFLRVMDGQFRKLAEDDDSGGGTDSRVVFEPKADGVYHVVATSLDGQLGSFTLTVRAEKK